MTRYPYDLKENPYPSSPTPTLADAKILGGKRHKEANAAVMSCIEDLYTKISGVLASDRNFRIIQQFHMWIYRKYHLVTCIVSIGPFWKALLKNITTT